MVNKLKRHAQTKQEVLSTSIEKQLPLKLARNISSNYNPTNSYNDNARNISSSYNNVASSYNGDVYYQQEQVQYQLPFYSDDNKQQVPFQSVDCK